MKAWQFRSALLILTIFMTIRYTVLFLAPSLPSKTPQPQKPKPPLLSSLPGLNSLFSQIPNSSAPSLLLWPHLRNLLLRPQALPATSRGVREAAAAWVLQNGQFVTLEGPKCPFAVAGNASGIGVPCGLVEGSAVSVVGVPGGNWSGFWFELVGSGEGEFTELPIVVRWNVSLEDGGVVFSQNFWSGEGGWGEWEHCPAFSSVGGGNSSYQRELVDGLVRCNELSSESGVVSVNGNGNGSRADGNEVIEQSRRSAHLSSGSPFFEGHPFTVTMWAGLEGFHLTVNGRHETSFTYQERLDPWSVTGVRIGGVMDVLTILANGLPVSEDISLLGDVDTLKAPPVTKKRLWLLIGVTSSVSNFKRRMALRRSWMQYEAVRSGVVAVRFLTGLHKNKQVNLELWKEAQTYGDIQIMPFVDYYSLITLKTIATYILGTKVLPAKYVMKTDDDAFVRIDEILYNLKNKTSSGLLYGLISFDSSPIRDKDSKWFISSEEWPHETYPPWAHGPGYIISRDIAKFIVQGHQERYLQLFKLEDVAVGIWIDEYRKSGHDVKYVNDDRFHNDGCDSNYLLAHYQSPRLVLCLWDKLQREHEPTCCE